MYVKVEILYLLYTGKGSPLVEFVVTNQISLALSDTLLQAHWRIWGGGEGLRVLKNPSDLYRKLSWFIYLLDFGATFCAQLRFSPFANGHAQMPSHKS